MHYVLPPRVGLEAATLPWHMQRAAPRQGFMGRRIQVQGLAAWNPQGLAAKSRRCAPVRQNFSAAIPLYFHAKLRAHVPREQFCSAVAS